MGKCISKNHSKFKLLFHLILVCKYRLKLLDEQVSHSIKMLSHEILNKHGCKIKYVETDLDHIHYLIETLPTTKLSDLVKVLKLYTTYHIWRTFDFSNKLWKERTFWTNGYFICSIGDISEQCVKQYIENQGR